MPDLDIARLVAVKTSQLDDVDRQLLHALTLAPRAPFRLLADVVGVSDQTIARRYRRLAADLGLRVLGLIDGERAGWVNWLVRLQAAPGSAQRIAETLARRPDTRWVRLVLRAAPRSSAPSRPAPRSSATRCSCAACPAAAT